MADKNLGDIIHDALHGKRYEPEKRLHDWYGYHGHRFPIKGGISALGVMKMNISKPSALWTRLTSSEAV